MSNKNKVKDFFTYPAEALKRTDGWQRFFYILMVFNTVVFCADGEWIAGLLWLGIGVFAFLNDWNSQIIEDVQKSNRELIELTGDLLETNRKIVEFYTGKTVNLEKDGES